MAVGMVVEAKFDFVFCTLPGKRPIYLVFGFQNLLSSYPPRNHTTGGSGGVAVL